MRLPAPGGRPLSLLPRRSTAHDLPVRTAGPSSPGRV